MLKSPCPWVAFSPCKCDTSSRYCEPEHKSLLLSDRENWKGSWGPCFLDFQEGGPPSEAGTRVGRPEMGRLSSSLGGALIKSLLLTYLYKRSNSCPAASREGHMTVEPLHRHGNSDTAILPFAIPIISFSGILGVLRAHTTHPPKLT